MMTEREYQMNEWMRFVNSKYSSFDTVKEFNDWILNSDILEQLEWIENGSFGAGACLELQRTYAGLTNRMNKRAQIGRVLLHALYGKPFNKWNKLSKQAQDKLNAAVDTWLGQDKDFAITSII